jgi:phosphoglycerate dehydrogenase-like enzyme
MSGRRQGASAVLAVAVPPELRASFFPDSVWDSLAALGSLRLPDDDADLGRPSVFAELVGPADVVVTSWGCARLSAEVLVAAPRLRLLAHTGASIKAYATAESFDRGVRVTQAGEPMAYGVGEQALALTLSLLHRVYRFDHALRSGVEWEVARDVSPPRELRGSVVGVVGASRTGRAYLGMVRALGAKVLVTDPHLSAPDAAALGATSVPLDELLCSSHVVSLHAPVLPATRNMIGARELALLRDGALLVNTARSALVDTEALLAELRSGRIEAALDVFDIEPLPVDHPLRALPNVLLTPHQAGATAQARRGGGEAVVAEIGRFLRGEPLRHEITPDMLHRMA